MNIKRPKDRDYRYVTKFLWIPKRFDGEWVWLEVVTIRQTYFYYSLIPGWYDVCRSNPITGNPFSFVPMNGDRILNQPMYKIGKYYCYYEGSYGKERMEVKYGK